MKNIDNPLLILLILLLSSCGGKEDQSASTADDSPNQIVLTASQMKTMGVQTVQPIPYAEEYAAVGEVNFDENTVIRIFPIVSGTVESVEVSLGDYVQRGQLLASMLSTDVTALQRNYNVAKADLEVAEKNLSRAEELYKTGMISEKEYAEARKDYANGLSDFKEKQQILELYGSSSERLDATFRVLAPRSGYIVERNINEGMQIRTDNNTNIFTISDLKTVWIWANVHESDMSKVHEGDRVAVKTIAYPDKTFTGTIKKIGTVLDPQSRVIRVRTELNNEEGLLKPQMFATIIITSRTSENVLAVPNKALVLENNNYYAMREVAPNTFEKVMVRVGRKFNDYAEVKEGLLTGDRIIIDGALFALTAFNQKS